MVVKPIKVRKFIPPKDNLWELLSSNINSLEENSIVVVTSKIVAIGEGRCVHLDEAEIDSLAIKEAELYLPRENSNFGWMHTIKNFTQVASAGIDKSNADGYFVLWPSNPEKSAKKIWKFLKDKFKVKNLGVIITDSHTVPLRRGLIGISIAHFGFVPLYDYRGQKDIFGEKLHVSQSNIPDSLASAAVLIMGEGKEQTPIAIITNLPKSVKFTGRKWSPRKPFSKFYVPMDEDLYGRFLKSLPWKKGGG